MMGNSLSKSINRTVIDMLKTLPNDFKGNWKYHLTKLTFAYNSTVNKSLGVFPFYLFWRDSCLPIDNMF